MLQQNSLHKHANVPDPSVKTIQEQLDEHNKEPKALTWSPSSPDQKWIKHPIMWLEQAQSMEATPWNPQDTNAVLPDATRSTLKVMY